MNPLLVTLALRAFKFLLAAPKLRDSFSSTLASERADVSPEVVSALQGDEAAIALLSSQIDEAQRENVSIVSRLQRRKSAKVPRE